MAQCEAIKRDGARCKVQAQPGATVCWGHDPARAETRRAIARKAGKAGGQGRPATEIHTIKGELRALIERVQAGTMERGDAITINMIWNTILRAVEIERKLKEHDELETRIAALEATVVQGSTKRWG